MSLIVGRWDVARVASSDEILVSPVSINFDRSGFQRDANTVYSVRWLRELAADGAIGGVAETHDAVMGSTDPATMQDTADQVSGLPPSGGGLNEKDWV